MKHEPMTHNCVCWKSLSAVWRVWVGDIFWSYFSLSHFQLLLFSMWHSGVFPSQLGSSAKFAGSNESGSLASQKPTKKQTAFKCVSFVWLKKRCAVSEESLNVSVNRLTHLTDQPLRMKQGRRPTQMQCKI